MRPRYADPPRYVLIQRRAVGRALAELDMNQPQLAEALSEVLEHPLGRQRVHDWQAGRPGRVMSFPTAIALADLVARHLGIGRGEAMALLVKDH